MLLCPDLYLKGHQLCPTFCFLRKGIMEPALIMCFWVAPQLDHAPKCSIWVFFEDEAIWRKIWFFTRSCFHAGFFFWISKLFQTQKSFWHQFKANSFWRNSSDSYVQVFISDEIIFILLLVKMRSDVLLVKNGSRFNPRVSKNQSSKHSFYLHE